MKGQQAKEFFLNSAIQALLPATGIEPVHPPRRTQIIYNISPAASTEVFLFTTPFNSLEIQE
jgi:hypothetical protein